MTPDYYYCITHKKCLLPEDKKEHRTPKCQFLLEDFQYKKHGKIKKFWMARTISEKLGMKIYTPKKEDKAEPVNTLPFHLSLIVDIRSSLIS